ncbi:MAG: hypothetical protein JWP90_1914, partial [Mycetocola sp.]|nr:hypothetical protein [Mycetocola sp.]
MRRGCGFGGRVCRSSMPEVVICDGRRRSPPGVAVHPSQMAGLCDGCRRVGRTKAVASRSRGSSVADGGFVRRMPTCGADERIGIRSPEPGRTSVADGGFVRRMPTCGADEGSRLPESRFIRRRWRVCATDADVWGGRRKRNPEPGRTSVADGGFVRRKPTCGADERIGIRSPAGTSCTRGNTAARAWVVPEVSEFIKIDIWSDIACPWC